jgi:AcrR family transcriptional regulator
MVNSATRQRLVAAAIQLFGERGYAATSVADIELASGLKPGSGGLYRHFVSKRELLELGVREQVESGRTLLSFLGDPERLSQLPLRERLMIVANAALARLDDERDLNRIILRDLTDFPELTEFVRVNELRNVQAVFEGWLKAQIEVPATKIDWSALAAVLMGAVSHYWVLRDALGSHPSGLSPERYLATVVDLAAGRLSAKAEETSPLA